MRTTVIGILFICFAWGLEAKERATINSSELEIRVKGQKKAEIIRRYSITIHDKEGYNLGIYHDYYDKFRKINRVSMVILDSTGKRVKRLGKADAIDYAFNASYETDDTRQLWLDPDYQQYPFTIEMEVEVDLKGFINLPTWMPRYAFDLAVQKSSLKVEIPDGFPVKMNQENIGEPRETTLVDRNEKAYTVYEWNLNNLEAIGKNMAYKTFYDSQAKVYISPVYFELDGYQGSMDSWVAFGDWFLEVNKGLESISESTKSELNEMENPDKRQLVYDIYDYMQEKTRYVSIQLGIGGFQSLPASLVDEKGYGDCKALTTYMKSMLDHKGIESNYILVRAGGDVPDVKEEFPSNQFNHVFLGVPLNGDTIMLECTSQLSPADYIGTFTDDRNVLWVKEGSSEIFRSPSYGEDDNVITKEATLEIDENGDGKLNLSANHKGIFYDQVFAYSQLNAKDVEKYNYELFSYRDFTISDFSYAKEESETAYSCQFVLDVNNLGKNTSSKLLVPINVLQSIDQYVKTDKYTKFSEVKRGFTLEEKVKIALPDNYWVQNLPDGREIESDFGSYSISLAHDGEFLSVIRKVIIKKGRYEQASFDEFYKFILRIKRTDATKIVMESKT